MQPVTKKKKTHGYDDDDDDMLSQLPEPIIGRILEFMPLPDAARTSRLSREWRHKWFHVSRIVCRSTPECRIERLLQGIIQLLQKGHGFIREFNLYVPDDLESCAEIDEISRLVFNKGCVRKIWFKTQEGQRSHVLDPSLFSCTQLVHVYLRGFVFLQPPPSFKGFSKLVSLLLVGVTITTQVLTTLISQSPRLEFLMLNCDAYAAANLEATAHNLKFFFCRGFFRSLVFVAGPHQYIVSLRLPFPRAVRAHADVPTVLQLKSVDSVVSLHLDYHYMKSLHRCGSGSKFENLRAVRLSGICFGIVYEVKCVLELMKSFACLETMIIEAFHVVAAGEDDEDDAVKLCEGLDVSCSRIREVQMLDVSGSKTEMAFVKTLLLKLQHLERMIIGPDLKNVGDGGFHICKLVCQFRRSSHLTAVEFRDSKDCKDLLNVQELEFVKSYFRSHSVKS